MQGSFQKHENNDVIFQYIYSLIIYTLNNNHLFTSNDEIHKYETRNNNNLHLPTANLSKFNKGA